VPESLAAAVAERAIPPEPAAEALAAARFIAEAGGPSVLAVIFFGSRKTKASPDASSAYDFFVLTGSCHPFYEGLRRRGLAHRSPALLALLNHLLPPNQISIETGGVTDRRLRAKCAVMPLADFLKASSGRRLDHFVLGRFCQPVEILFAAGDEVRHRVLAAVVSAHRLTYLWVRPWLPREFDLETYCRTALRVSYAGEIRPEPEGRADALWRAQEGYHRPVYGALLAELAAQGEVTQSDSGAYRLARPAAAWERLRLALYFRWSKVRATARWAKYVLTFEGWLDFIVSKARRHSGQAIDLSERERRRPLLYLWPRVIRYLRHKDR